MDWKKLFDEKRLDKGYKYYLEDKVYDVILTDNTITAKVEGSKSVKSKVLKIYEGICKL